MFFCRRISFTQSRLLRDPNQLAHVTAVRVYQRLGYEKYCQYYEGLAKYRRSRERDADL